MRCCSGKGAVGLDAAAATGNRLADSVDPAVFRTLPQLQDIQVCVWLFFHKSRAHVPAVGRRC